MRKLGLAMLFVASLAMAQQPVLGPKLPPRAPAVLSVKPKEIDWKREVVYFLLVDRFSDGDPSNNENAGRGSHKKFYERLKNFDDLKTYQGGDILGVASKLDYLKEMGITTIWLSPLYENPNQDFLGWWSYHGYHPVDHFEVEKTFGDFKTLRKLVDEAHARGMKVILDMVYNQVGAQHPWVQDAKNWHDKGFVNWFHEHSGKDAKTSIKNWEDPWELENRELFGLPDLKQENANVYDFLLDMSKFWVEKTGADGFRLDAVKHVNSSFWKRINADLHGAYGKNFLMLGEVFHGDTRVLAKYQNDDFNALFDIPLYFDVRRVFAEGNSFEVLSNRLQEESRVYSGDMLWSTLIDNHDLERFSFVAKTNVRDKLKNAITFLAVMNGLPVIYYGTEVALEGGASTDAKGNGTEHLNRRMMPWERVDAEKKNGGIINHMKQIFALRRERKSLYDGKMIELYKDPCVYVFAKVADDDTALVAFNNCSVAQKISVPARMGLFGEGQEISEFWGGEIAKVAGGKIAIELNAYSAKVFTRLNATPVQLSANFDWTVPMSANEVGDFVRHKFSADFPKATSVSVAGDFNGWSPTQAPLSKNPATGKWEGVVTVKRGKHPYKFVVNGKDWLVDDAAKQFESDPYGGKNSILNLP